MAANSWTYERDCNNGSVELVSREQCSGNPKNSSRQRPTHSDVQDLDCTNYMLVGEVVVVEFEAAEKCSGRLRCHHVRSHSALILLPSIGQRPQDSSDLLQGPGLQETYSTQSYAVQSRQSKDHPAPQLPKTSSDNQLPRPHYSRKENEDTTASSQVTVVRRNLCSKRRRRQPRRSC